MNESAAITVRISRLRAGALALVLLLLLPTYSIWMYDGVRSTAAFEQVQARSEGNRRCIACHMTYPTYRVLVIGVIVVVNTVFGAAAVTAFMRAFGPPALVVFYDRRWRYRFPGRVTREFLPADGSRVVINRTGIEFHPPATAADGSKPISRLNLRTVWTTTTPTKLASALNRLNPSWQIKVG